MGTKIVAIVDDDPSVLDTLSMTFEQSGWQVISGNGFDQIVERIKDIQQTCPMFLPEAFVVDYKLGFGKTTGLAVIKNLEAFCRCSHRSVLISGDIADATTDEARLAGVILLHKPFKFDALIDAVEGCAELADMTMAAASNRHRMAS